MSKNCVFYLEESASNPGKFLIKVVHEKFFLEKTSGSYNLIAARVMNISYPNFLRLCRDEFGAEIIGKNSYYPVAYFTKGTAVNALIDNLNARADLIIWEREHPDSAQHEQMVKELNPEFYKKVRE